MACWEKVTLSFGDSNNYSFVSTKAVNGRTHFGKLVRVLICPAHTHFEGFLPLLFVLK